MSGFKTQGTGLVTNTLSFGFAETSGLMSFVATGMNTGGEIAFAMNGRFLGSFDLEHAGAAFGDLKTCLGSPMANYEA